MKKSKTIKKYINKKYSPIILFLIGLLICIYPIISQYYYKMDFKELVNTFDKTAQKLPSEEVKKRIELAKIYNKTLDPSKISDPYGDNEKEAIAEYARMLEVKEMLGHIKIPKINEDIPIYAGTSEEVLQKGAGHLEGTSLPIGGEGTHTVITAHRGLSNIKMFRRLDELEIGDIFLIYNIEKVLAYKVDRILTVEPTNFKPILVTEGDDYATLLTCTPYVVNSHRLLVRGYRIEYNPEEVAKDNMKQKSFIEENIYFLLAILILIILFLSIFIKRKRK